MARARTARVTQIRTVRAPAPIIRVSAPRAVKIKRQSRRRRSSVGSMSTSNLTSVAIGAAAFGYLEKSDFGKSLPTIPALGRKGSLAIAAYFASKQFKSPLLRDICVAAVALSAYEFAQSGKISGDDDDGYSED